MNINWDNAAEFANAVIKALEPAVDLAVPGASAGIHIVEQIVQGVIAGKPAAKAIYQQVVDGTPVTPDQIQQYIAAEDAEYASNRAKMVALLADTPA